MENFQRPTPLPDWKHCPNCNEQYGKVAMDPHVARCKKLFPDGRNGFVAEGGGGGGKGQGMSAEEAAAAARRAEANLEKIRQMFDHFDADKNGQLSADELAALLRQVSRPSCNTVPCSEKDPNPNPNPNSNPNQCFPTRAADAAALAAEFAAADADGSGGVSFDEFVEYHNALAGHANRFDEASDMFRAFDTDTDGHLDRAEFLSLLQQVFPQHCEEIEQMFDGVFEAADADHSGKISFGEL